MFSAPINPRITRAIVPLPLRFGPTSKRDFLLPGVWRQKVADPFLKCADTLGIVRPKLAQEGKPGGGRGRLQVKSKSRQFAENKPRPVGGAK